MNNIYRKNNLGRNLNKMKKVLPEWFNFFPQTWLLPLEKNDLMNQFRVRKSGPRGHLMGVRRAFSKGNFWKNFVRENWVGEEDLYREA